uniref:Sulfide/dihydroorotate dehydrogenase-like FAD/NAD-binding protein n=1 Tax=candidate division WOR-3 bacterium TaxID=2052148 RepID=A0A7C2K5I1_UNCW3
MGFKILQKVQLGPDSFLMKVHAPYVAQNAKPGQFIVLIPHEKGERIPLTISKADRITGEVQIIFQVVGKSTKYLSLLNEGDEISDFVGPLGRPTEIENFGTVACLGGGFGTAVLYPLVRALRDAGNYIIVINGARSANLLILEDELKSLSDEYYVTTDDGTKGMKGFVTDYLRKLLEEGKKIDRVFAVGPVPMMRAVANLTKEWKIKTIVSLNPIMVDGTGMCGACRVSVGGETKFACVDGPEFDAHLVDFDLLMKRLEMYKDLEKYSYELLLKELEEGGCRKEG